MSERPKLNQAFVHVQALEETEESKCFGESSENGDEPVPLGLSGRAVCMQVF